MAAVMFVASASLDFAWADSHTERLWKQWLRSPIRGSGYMTQMVCIFRTCLLLNRHFIERDPQLLREVRRDLKLVAQNTAVPAGAASRIEARLVHASGDRQRAALLMREAVDYGLAQGRLSEVARDRYALGVLTGGLEGAALQSSGLAQLSELGYVDPLAEMRANYPEFSPT
jgi:hypothetical protein